VNSINLADRHVTVKKKSLQLDIGEASVCRILNKLGYLRVFNVWVLQQLTDTHKEQKAICTELLAWFHDDGEEFLAHIMMGDEM
jgi:hypothetical protein